MEIRERKMKLRREMRRSVASAFDADPEARRVAEKRIVEKLDRLLRGLKIRNPMGIWAFWPTLPEEPDFRSWLCGLMASGIHIGLPRLNWENRTLAFHQVTDPELDLEFDARGLAEPRADLAYLGADRIVAVLVPGLAFDSNGGRLGRGAGFYDRTLEQVPSNVLRVGICFDEQVVEDVPQDSWDHKVNVFLSPRKGFMGNPGIREFRDPPI